MNFMRLSAVVTVLALCIGLASPAWAATVRIRVNDTSITDTQISARANLLRLERRGSSNSARLELAREELIEEALKLQEAERLEISVTDSEVSSRFLDVARNMNVSEANLQRILTENGVNPDTLRARLRAGIAWQRVTRQMIAPRVQISDLELEKQAEEQLEQTESYDYLLKEVLFLVPDGSGMSASGRTAQANQYRRSFSGCDSAVDLSLSYTDAAVIDVGRRHATQMPDAIARELANLSEGGITTPRVTDRGVSMLAVCSKASAHDLTFIKNDLRQEAGNEKLQEEADAHLEELRQRAAISVN